VGPWLQSCSPEPGQEHGVTPARGQDFVSASAELQEVPDSSLLQPAKAPLRESPALWHINLPQNRVLSTALHINRAHERKRGTVLAPLQIPE